MVLGNLRLEAVGSDLAISVTHGLVLLVGEHSLLLLDLLGKEIDSLLAEGLSSGLVLFLLVVDVVADVVDLSLALLDRRIQLHSLISRVLQVLLEIGDLTAKLALG